MARVEIERLTKTYGRYTVVSEVSLEIAHGELVALLGPSGCGKTTTLQMLAGFTDITSGDIRIDGRSIASMPPHHRNIGVVFQSYALFPHLTVFDNVAFGLKMRKVASAAIADRVNRALDLVRLGGMQDRYPKSLSGGQQQRVALARALVIEPQLLLLDEPLSNLDANLREQMRFEIRDIQQRIGITTVFVTHDQAEAMAVADRLVVMSAGSIRQVGTPRQIYQDPTDRFVAEFIGQANLITAKAGRCEGSTQSLTLDSGEEIVANIAQPIQPGESVTLAIRHEAVRLTRSAPDRENHLAGRIEHVHYLGAQVNIDVRCGERQLTAIAPSSGADWSAGDSVFVCWPATAGWVFNETGQRL